MINHDLNAKISRTKPFMHGTNSVMGLSIDLIIALVPAIIWGVFRFGFRALLVILLSTAAAVVSEFLYELIFKRKNSIKDLTAVVTGLILGLSLPASVSLWIPIVGSMFAIIVAKQVFGGLGKNIVNPAIVSRAFLMICFPTELSGISENVVSSATPLSYLKAGVVPSDSAFSIFIGNTSGAIGEISAVAIIFGLIYLLVRKVINWRIPLTICASVFVVSLIFPLTGTASFAILQLTSGGILFASVFCATDPATSPSTNSGRVVYGLIIAVVILIIRYFGSLPDGTAFAIIIANLFVPLINRCTIKRRKGGTV